MKNSVPFFFYLILLSITYSSCHSDRATLLLINGQFYTVDKNRSIFEAIAISENRILALGNSDEILNLADDETTVIDLNGNFAMPGFIEGHGHFSGLGSSLMNLNFLKSRSWEEIVEMVQEKVQSAEPGEWITGRGWHQEKWDLLPEIHHHGYPVHDQLSAVSPDNPVMLSHASGHSLFANKMAMDLSGINIETPNPKGGEIVRDENGNAIGVFEERAMYLVRAAYQSYLNSLSQEDLAEQWFKAIDLAQTECLSKGVTSFQDAGTRVKYLPNYEQLAEEGKLDLRLWVMARDSLHILESSVAKHRKVDLGNGHYTCRAIKSEVDGALGAYGAWLLEPYNDKQDFIGQNTTEISRVEAIANIAMNNDMQLCVHAIGDRANREVLDLFEGMFDDENKGKERRWRMEHAQHIDPADIPRFSQLGVIASMQGIHCTSDAPFVVKRLGEERAKYGAYPWRSLLETGAIVTNGTDAPVEDVDPIESYYASVTRKRTDSEIEFFPEQKMSRDEAIYSYTMANAIAAFEEDDKGSLETGKYADIVVLSKNLIECSDDEIMDTEILYTIVGGDIKFQK